MTKDDVSEMRVDENWWWRFIRKPFNRRMLGLKPIAREVPFPKEVGDER